MRWRSTSLARLAVVCTACFAFLLSACETSVAPRSGADRHFSLYGVLNPLADSQAVLVFPVEDELVSLVAEPLPARVFSTDLETSETIEWRDSILVQEQGAVHVFWAEFRAAYDRDYRIRVESTENDETSEVNVRVPPRAEIEPMPAKTDIWVTQDVTVTAPVPRLNFLLVRYVIKARLPKSSLPFPVLTEFRPPEFGDAAANPPPPPLDDIPEDSLVVQQLFVPIDYSQEATLSPSGWTIPINLSFDFREIRRRMSHRGTHDPIYGVRLEEIQISFVAANAEWAAPDERYEADILIQPGTMSNVENGFGFVGAGYRLSKSYNLPNDVLVRIGFSLPDGTVTRSDTYRQPWDA